MLKKKNKMEFYKARKWDFHFYRWRQSGVSFGINFCAPNEDDYYPGQYALSINFYKWQLSINTYLEDDGLI